MLETWVRSLDRDRKWTFQVALVVKNPPANVENVGDVSSIPLSGRSPWRGHGTPLQYSCLENPVDSGDWWAAVHRVTKNWTWLKRLSTHAHPKYSYRRALAECSVHSNVDFHKIILYYQHTQFQPLEEYIVFIWCIGNLGTHL